LTGRFGGGRMPPMAEAELMGKLKAERAAYQAMLEKVEH